MTSEAPAQASPPVSGPGAVHGIRGSMAGLALFGALVTLAPGIGIYVGLRAAGLGIGPAGVLGLLAMFAGCFAYCGWLFAGGRAAGVRR